MRAFIKKSEPLGPCDLQTKEDINLFLNVEL